MIKLFDGWEIDRGLHGGYELRLNAGTTTVDKRTGRETPVYKKQFFPGTFQNCLKRLADEMFRQEIHDADMTLQEAIKTYDEITKRIETELNGRTL